MSNPQAAAKAFIRDRIIRTALYEPLDHLLIELDYEDAEAKADLAPMDDPDPDEDDDSPLTEKEITTRAKAHKAAIESNNTHAREKAYKAFIEAVKTVSDGGELNAPAYQALYAVVAGQVAEYEEQQRRHKARQDALQAALDAPAEPDVDEHSVNLAALQEMARQYGGDGHLGRLHRKTTDNPLERLRPHYEALQELMRDSGLLPGPAASPPPPPAPPATPSR